MRRVTRAVRLLIPARPPECPVVPFSALAAADRKNGDGKALHQHGQCAICLQDFKMDDAVVRLRCGHVLHHADLKVWLESGFQDSCPLCRAPISRHCREDVLSYDGIMEVD